MASSADMSNMDGVMVTVWEGGVQRQVSYAEMMAMDAATEDAAHDDAAAAPASLTAEERVAAEMVEMAEIQAAMERGARARESLSQITIAPALTANDDLVEAMGVLMPQLTTTRAPPSAEQLAAIVASPSTTLLVARFAGKIAGSLAVVIFDVPSGRRAAVEDLVVSESARGRGIGRQLLERALDVARGQGAVKIALTSRPSRVAANALYKRTGFELRETNCYSLAL